MLDTCVHLRACVLSTTNACNCSVCYKCWNGVDVVQLLPTIGSVGVISVVVYGEVHMSITVSSDTYRIQIH